MRQQYGLAELVNGLPQRLTLKALAALLLADLETCHGSIYGKDNNDNDILLVELTLDELSYEIFDHRIDLKLSGDILNTQFPPLTYQVAGDTYYFKGRCSVLACVCGVDLYLSKSFQQPVGATAYQAFQISVTELFKRVH